ncbi:MAG: hypothetical protein NT047_03535 [Deltaproteobacteria bacterium]|nr:hypothetical protein [Deltaproteobacteria bacterium]
MVSKTTADDNTEPALHKSFDGNAIIIENMTMAVDPHTHSPHAGHHGRRASVFVSQCLSIPNDLSMAFSLGNAQSCTDSESIRTAMTKVESEDQQVKNHGE